MEDIYQRTEIILGKENIKTISNLNIVICGIGGVGSFTLESLARIGVGNITIIDKDVIDITNINRQIIATSKNIGKDKVEEAQKRVNEINPEIKVKAIKENITSENISKILNNDNIDYVVDCVDNIEAKIAIMLECNKKNIRCISCMGMGNKLNPLDIKISDIYKTNTCPLAKIIRKKLKENNIKNQKVVFSTELPKKKTIDEKEIYGNTLGSVSFVPSVAGLILASEVIKDLIK